MISFFPTIREDELLYSSVARYHIQSGNALYRQTLQDLFGDANAHSSAILPTRLGTMAEQTESFGYSFEELLYNHTIFPFLTAFYDDVSVANLYTRAKESQSGPIHSELGLFGSSDAKLTTLRFCPGCYTEELKRFGEGYWHRLHQTPGVYICEKHRTPLLSTLVPIKSNGSNQYHPANPSTLFPAAVPAPLSQLAQQQLGWIVDDTVFVYREYKRIHSAYKRQNYSFRQIFLPALKERGIATNGGSLRLDEFRKQFCTFFAPDLLDALNLSFDESVRRPWIVAMFRSRRSVNTHPLPLMLMSRFLLGGLPKLIEAAESMAVNSVMKVMQTRLPPADFAQKRDTYRTRWLAACEKMPNACQNDIRKTAGAVYTWLYRHDREWLSTHPAERKTRGGNKTYADWSSRDHQFADRVPHAAEQLRDRPGKPIRITKTSLLHEIGCGILPSELLDRMPRTTEAIHNAVEDTMSFRLRRICWAEQTFLDFQLSCEKAAFSYTLAR